MWKSIIVVKPDLTWKFTPEVVGTYFRLRHINPPRSPVGWVAQVEAIPNTNFHLFYKPERINGLSVFELIELQKPVVFESRKLAFRQEFRTPNEWLIEIEVNIEMPGYSLEDAPIVNPTASSVKNVTTVAVANTVTKVLPANPNRKAIKFFSADKLRNVYLDTDNVVSATNAIESLTPSKPVSVPFVNWTGEWYAVSSSGTITIEVEEYV